jgi:gamma-glutamylcyclotransferase (GGCT)/AIG2-like uncharacterized protein YtfP
LFIYGSLLEGETDHALLEGAERLGAAQTEPRYHLFDIGAYAAMVPDGSTSVCGEIYLAPLETRAHIDVKRQVPILFERALVKLMDGESAEAYLMSAEKVRGRRRLHHGDWRKRFLSNVPRAAPGPFVRWARGRFSNS